MNLRALYHRIRRRIERRRLSATVARVHRDLCALPKLIEAHPVQAAALGDQYPALGLCIRLYDQLGRRARVIPAGVVPTIPTGVALMLTLDDHGRASAFVAVDALRPLALDVGAIRETWKHYAPIVAACIRSDHHEARRALAGGPEYYAGRVMQQEAAPCPE